MRPRSRKYFKPLWASPIVTTNPSEGNCGPLHIFFFQGKKRNQESHAHSPLLTKKRHQIRAEFLFPWMGTPFFLYSLPRIDKGGYMLGGAPTSSGERGNVCREQLFFFFFCFLRVGRMQKLEADLENRNDVGLLLHVLEVPLPPLPVPLCSGRRLLHLPLPQQPLPRRLLRSSAAGALRQRIHHRFHVLVPPPHRRPDDVLEHGVPLAAIARGRLVGTSAAAEAASTERGVVRPAA